MRSYVALLLSLAALWGASYMFIEIALRDLEPTTMMAGRLVISTLVVGALMAARGMLGRIRRVGWKVFSFGVINNAAPFTLIAWGQKHIDSGVAAIANATVPLFVAVLAIWLAHSERATGLRIVGIALGLAGVAVLSGAQPAVDTWAIVGTLAVVAASILYALAGILLQRETARVDSITLAMATMTGASIALLPFGVAQAPHELPGWEAAASVLALGVLGTAAGMLIFMKLLSDHGALRAGFVTYLLPVTALLYGAFLLDEVITGWMVVGLVLVLGGVALGSGLIRPEARAEAVEPARP